MINKAAYDTLKPMLRANWQQQLRNAVRDPAALLKMLELPLLHDHLPRNALREFPLKVTPGFVRRIRIGTPDDPLLRQILPLAQEDSEHPGFTPDPVGESERRLSPGLLQKYHGRALLITTGSCAVHCRYCFRRHFPYTDESITGDNWETSLDLLARDCAISEIILSGGDPLVLRDEKLFGLIGRLERIAHLKRLRIHSRVPVVLPERITDELIAGLLRTRLTPVMVIHCNHPDEIDDQVAGTLRRIRQAGLVVLNQSVLLHGVNDAWEPIAALSERLFDCGVLPYYLHMLDPVAGAAHFHVPVESALTIMEQLRRRLPGYLVPRLVQEQSGAPYKIPVL